MGLGHRCLLFSSTSPFSELNTRAVWKKPKKIAQLKERYKTMEKTRPHLRKLELNFKTRKI